MKKLLLLTLLLAFAMASIAADKTYYSYPQVKRLRDTSRVLIYDNLSGSRNITGGQFKSEIVNQASVNAALATATNASPIIKKSGSGDGPYVRQLEVRNASGAIVYWVNTSGQMIFGTPVTLSISSVFPANGATGVSILGIPSVTFNKSTAVSLSTMYIQGNSTAPVYMDGDGSTWYIPATPFAYGTTYTTKVVRSSITQTDGETSSSCGSVMTDVSGVCTSTWTTATLSISSITPAAGATGVAGTDGGAFTTPIGVTFNTGAVLVTGPDIGTLSCSSNHYSGSQWMGLVDLGDSVTTDYLTWTLPNEVYYKSYDAGHLTTYSCRILKDIGLTGCAAGTTDTGTSCSWSFTAAQ